MLEGVKEPESFGLTAISHAVLVQIFVNIADTESAERIFITGKHKTSCVALSEVVIQFSNDYTITSKDFTLLIDKKLIKEDIITNGDSLLYVTDMGLGYLSAVGY